MDPSRARRSSAASTLRTAAVWATVSEAAAGQSAALGRPLRVLDLGGGTGGLAVPLAEHGHDVTVVDPSPDALASLRRRGVADRVRAVQGDTDSVHDVVGANARYDLICVHGTLEVADDPDAAVAHVTGLLDEGAVLSIVVAQRLSAALARALAGEFERAQAILERPDGRWGDGDPGPRRYDEANVVDLLTRHGLDVRTSHGVRIFSDHVPSTLLDTEADRRDLLTLEATAGALSHTYPLLGSLGAALHVLAHRH